MTQAPIRLCFVCLGNICRSPTAEAVMRKLVDDAGLTQRISIDSAGTGDYHVGEPADTRSSAEARRRGIELTGVARQFVASDFGAFDYVLAMDRRNLRDLRELAQSPAERAKLHLLRSFEPGASGELDVPDPYAGDGDGFVRVYDICVAACSGLLSHLRSTYGI
jgi:protein-tyrosine phosphatase